MKLIRYWALDWTIDGPAGTYLQVLPTFNVFYPTKHYDASREVSCTIHLGWLAWILNVHFCWDTRRPTFGKA